MAAYAAMTSRRTWLARFALLTLSVVAVLAAVEAYVRLTWDARRGTPNLYVSDAELAQRFTPNYEGWFAGVPIRINNLGLHDPRDYTVEKGPRTVRLLVLGDSVAFGHGSIYAHTYPRLLEDRLREWRPDIDWQVWNAGVPGYNTAQELALLNRHGRDWQPDLVIVGFHPNDIVNNDIVQSPTARRVAATAVRNWVKQAFYSYELYRRLLLTARWRMLESTPSRTLLENLGAEDALLSSGDSVEAAPAQRISPLTPLSDDVLAAVNCRGDGKAADEVKAFEQEPAAASWRKAVQGLQDLHAAGTYRIVFFVNTAPDICPGDDLFFDGGSGVWNDFFVRELSRGAPTLSTYDAVRRHRPSEMPDAHAHALGNVNRLKADLLFAFLAQHGLNAIPALAVQR